MARCEFCDRSRNTLATLGLSDRSRGGAVRIYRILRSLAQHSCHFGPLRSLSWWRGAMRSLPQPSRHFEFGPLRSLSLWRGANFAIARATLLPLWASQIALVVARCEFLRSLAQHTRHFGPIRSLSWWRGAMRSLPQPSRHIEFGPLRSLSLWRGANFAIARATHLPLWASQIALVVVRCELISNFAIARATLFPLWASEIALVVARCNAIAPATFSSL